MKDASVKEVLREIEKQSDFTFFYNDLAFDMNRKVKVNASGTKIEHVLKTILPDCTFEIDGKRIILIPEIQSPTQDKRKITGAVVDETGEPVTGANVVEKGTANGVITDMDGKFSMQIPDNVTLQISYIGYISAEVHTDNQNNYSIVLKEDLKALEEVVVVGYGTQKKANLTGSVSTVSSNELLKRPVSNTTLLVQGKVPGLRVSQNSAIPGNESVSMKIRGEGTFSSAGNAPLVLIDGIAGNFESLNPEMIESVTVLKDAASASIYGARAANGVILITTKTGATGRMNIDYHFNMGFHKATDFPKLIRNSAEYMELVNEAITNSGDTRQKYSREQIDAYRNNAGNPQYPNTKWEDYVLRTAPVQNHYLSINGGNDKTGYNFVLGYVDQEGIIIHTNSKKYSLMLDIRSKTFNDRITFGVNANMMYSHWKMPFNSSDNAYPLFTNIYQNKPTYAPYLPDGSGRYVHQSYSFEYNNQNCVALANEGYDKSSYINTTATAFINFKIMKGLIWETKGSVSGNFNEIKSQKPGQIPLYDFHTYKFVRYLNQWNETEIKEEWKKTLFFTIYSTLNYSMDITENLSLNALAGVSTEVQQDSDLSGFRKGFPSLELDVLDAGDLLGQTAGGNLTEWGIQSVFGRLNGSFYGRYLMEVNMRYDGSSRFSGGNRWGFFPSVSFGWRISEESFMKDMDWLSNLKIRGSWGRLGNQNIGIYPYQNLLTLGMSYPFGNTVERGVYQERLENTNLTWEEAEMADAGIDFGMWGGKIYATVDWFSKRTQNILRTLQVPGSLGLSGSTINNGEVEDRGWEFSIGYQDKTGAFQYGIDANYTTYKNKLVKFGAQEISGNYIRKEGLPYNSFYMYDCIGIFQSAEEIAEAPVHQNNPQPGDLRFRDVSGPDDIPDGKIDQYDRVIIPGKTPKGYYGFNLNLQWKNVDLSCFFQGVYGNKIYATQWGIEPFSQYSRPHIRWRDRWTPENPSTTLPRLYIEGSHPTIQASTGSSYWLSDAGYLRLKNLQIGYNIPLTTSRINSLRIYFSGDNLLTFTKYPQGGDPERNYDGRFAIHPQTTIYSFGVKARF
ncbi:MAG: TonB-dependent receptor [Tannerella sp.]|jgi:TonB-linked SusC/RagA family outer membrane protein|nr:TonB-dependent receptor [Tannerella sp.]